MELRDVADLGARVLDEVERAVGGKREQRELILIGLLAESAPGWWSTPMRKAAVDAFNTESDPQKRVALWANVQKAIYAETPSLKIGDFNALAAQATKLDGVTPAPWPYFWNAYLK